MSGVAPRSLLFVPATSDRFVAAAPGSGADALILDLEDAIAPAEKPQARAALARQVPALSGQAPWIRVNAEAALLADDIGAAARPGVRGVLLPKAAGAADVLAAEATMARAECANGLAVGSLGLLALVETPDGVAACEAIARAGSRLRGLVFGAEDFSLSLDLDPDSEAVALAAARVAFAARAAGRQALGLPGSIAEFRDLAAFERLAERARGQGFTGSVCIHPRQVAVLNQVFGVSDEAHARAAAICAAFEGALAEGRGAIAHEGRMIDRPVYERARRLCARHRALHGR